MGRRKAARGASKPPQDGPLGNMKLKLIKSDMDRTLKRELITCVSRGLKMAPSLAGLAELLQLALNQQVRGNQFPHGATL